MVKRMMCLVVALCVGPLARGQSSQRCWDRHELKERGKILKDATCTEPKDTLLPLPVPDGYDWVFPSVVMVKHCQGHMCTPQDTECVGVESTNRTIKVQAYKMDNIMDQMCTSVTVQVHSACGCRCVKNDKECGHNEVFNKKLCRCECKPRTMPRCLEMMERFPNKFMWDQKSCSCPCNNEGEECGSGTVWVPDMCRCMRVMVSDEEDEDNMLHY